jgi:hypothetical protein
VSALEVTGSALSSSLLTVSGSDYATSASLSTASGSFNSRVATIESKYATTGSNTFIGTQVVSGSVLQSGSFTTTGTIIAQTINVQQVTSSVVYSSGSNVFGNDIGNSQTFTGSVLITGSLAIAGASSATSYSGTTIFGSTIACSPIGCFATSCATSFIGGTMSGTTIYGSTAVCSANGLLIGNGGVTATCNYLPKFTGASTIGNSIVSESSGIVSVAGRFSASGNDFHSVIVDQGTAQLKLERITTSAGYMYIGADNVGFKILDSAFATRLTLTSGGNLGLGVTPSYKLDVYSSTTATQVIGNFSAANYGSPSSRSIIQIGTQYEDGSSRIASVNTTGNQSALIFQSHAATSGVWNDAMYIDGGGEVLIGTTTNAGYKLDVNGTGRFSGGLTIKSGNGDQLQLNNAGERFTQINFSNNTVSKANIWWDNTNTELVLLASGSGTGHLKIASTGAATFNSSVAASYYSFTGAIPSSAASTGYIDYSGATTRFFSVGTSGATKGAFDFIAKGSDNSSTNPLSINNTGAATFSSSGANLATFKTNNATDSYNSGVILAGNANATQASRNAYILLDPNGANGTGVDYGFFTALGTGETQIGTSKSDGFLALYTADTEKMRITSTGNIGIGTCIPSSYGGYLNTTLQSTGASGVNLDFKTCAGTREGVLLLSSGTEFALIAATAIPLTFRTTDAEKMRISANGVVSINPGSAFNFRSYQTAGSTTGLTVSSGIPRNSTNNESNHVTWIGSCDATYPVGVVIGFRSHTTDCACRFPYLIGTQIGQTPSHLALNPDGGSVANIFIHTYTADTAGWTFVGSSPGYGVTKRSGTGNQTHISFQNDNGQVGYISTSGTATTFSTNGSDIRCKKNFETWNENASSLFTDILPMKFNYTVECDEIQKTKGFIAQCMVNKFPEAYPTNECGTYAFNPSGMVVYLMKAVQEQQCTINTLKTCLGIV